MLIPGLMGRKKHARLLVEVVAVAFIPEQTDGVR